MLWYHLILSSEVPSPITCCLNLFSSILPITNYSTLELVDKFPETAVIRAVCTFGQLGSYLEASPDYPLSYTSSAGALQKDLT